MATALSEKERTLIDAYWRGGELSVSRADLPVRQSAAESPAV